MESNTKHKKIIKHITLERVPEKNTSLRSRRLLNEHLLRYKFAGKFVKNKIILDIACGSGYGTNLLIKKGAKFAYGIDNNRDAVKIALDNYSQKNIKFSVGNAERINLKKESVDLVISLETIEHLKNPKQFINEISRVLKPKGLLILSTPNKDFSYEDNPYHIHEFTFDELRLLLNEFKNIKFYGQRKLLKKVVKFYKYLYINIFKYPLLSRVQFLLRFRPWEKQQIHKLRNQSDNGYVYYIVVCNK